MRVLLMIVGCVGLASAAAAQTQRRATLTANGDNGRAKCTIEVVVDGSADIEISGDSGVIRNQSGRPPQWRRFECTARMPANPVGFHFSGVDGRGRQQLVRDPQNGGVAVVRIDDKDGGAEAYTFDLTWAGGQSGNYPASVNDRFPGRLGNNRTGDQQGYGTRRFGTEESARACQQAVREQASSRFGGAELAFRTTAQDDHPGRRDWVVGTFEVRNRGRGETYRFSCSVDFDAGRIRSVDIESRQSGRDSYGPGDRTALSQQVQSCERALSDRVRRDGYTTIDIEPIRADTRRERSDLIVGTLRANRRDGSDSFNFSCSLNPDGITVRSIDLRRR